MVSGGILKVRVAFGFGRPERTSQHLVSSKPLGIVFADASQSKNRDEGPSERSVYTFEVVCLIWRQGSPLS